MQSRLALRAGIAAAATAAAIAVFASGLSPATAAAESPRKAPARQLASPPAPLTFSPRSSFARLDLLRSGLSPLAVGDFFSVADPSLSPSGQLAFVASKCASCPQRLTIVSGRKAASFTQAMSVTWLNERQLLTSAGRGEETEIRLIDRNGRGHELAWLTAAADRMAVETEKELVVSPNRRTLLFSGEGSAEHHGNYIVDLVRHRLFPLAGEADDAPSFSPDGRAIAYQQVSRGGDWDICVSHISSRAASHERCFRFPGGNDRQPAFLPNGREIVFSSDRAARRSGASSLYVLDLRTGSVRRLTPAGYDATSPTVAPDGRSVIFVRRALVPLR